MHAWTCRACPCMPVHTVSFLTGELGKEKETAWEGSSGVEVTLPFLRNVPRSSGTENPHLSSFRISRFQVVRLDRVQDKI